MEPTASSDGSAAGLMFIVFFYLAMIAIIVASRWKIFTKAGKPGWASIVPIYDTIVFLEIIGKPIWWLALMFIPFVNIIISIIMIVELARVFGKSGGFTAGLIFLGLIFFPILAFGSSQYVGAAGGTVPVTSSQYTTRPQQI